MKITIFTKTHLCNNLFESMDKLVNWKTTFQQQQFLKIFTNVSLSDTMGEVVGWATNTKGVMLYYT